MLSDTSLVALNGVSPRSTFFLHSASRTPRPFYALPRSGNLALAVTVPIMPGTCSCKVRDRALQQHAPEGAVPRAAVVLADALPHHVRVVLARAGDPLPGLVAGVPAARRVAALQCEHRADPGGAADAGDRRRRADQGSAALRTSDPPSGNDDGPGNALRTNHFAQGIASGRPSLPYTRRREAQDRSVVSGRARGPAPKINSIAFS
eukprot:gene9846-biopygen2918